jgi:hypothetical protein
MTPLTIAGRTFSSRLFLGTGKFPSNEAMRDALAASGTQIVTVALRRADLTGGHDPFANILDFIDPEKYLLLPNTSGAMNAEEAVRLARLAAAAGLPKWVKLEIHPDPTYLLPGSHRDPQSRRNPRQGRLHRPALHQRRSGPRQTFAGSRHRHRHAARRADRLEQGPRHPRPDPHHHRTSHRAGRRRCRHRCAQPRRRGDGTRGRRRAGQHRHRHRQRSRAAWPSPSNSPSKPAARPTNSGCRSNSTTPVRPARSPDSSARRRYPANPNQSSPQIFSTSFRLSSDNLLSG